MIRIVARCPSGQASTALRLMRMYPVAHARVVDVREYIGTIRARLERELETFVVAPVRVPRSGGLPVGHGCTAVFHPAAAAFGIS